MDRPQPPPAPPLGSPLLGIKEGRLRWAVSATEWSPAGEKSGPEFQFLLSLICEPEEREAVTRFVHFVDQKRALLSRLLVRRACHAVLGLGSFRDLRIGRTKGKKPFLLRPRPPQDRPDLANFNFNVSHEGDWVVLASEPLCIVGVDVSAPHDRRRGSIDIFEVFEEQLTAEEWRVVRHEAAVAAAERSSTGPAAEDADGPGIQPPGYQAFQRFWSAKEAFVKARGDGLGFELNRAEFRFQAIGPVVEPGQSIDAYVATVAIDGAPAPLWRCFQHRLGEDHWTAVARGPTQDVVDAQGEFLHTLQRPTSSFSAEAWQQELSADSPPFQPVTVGFLVPPDDTQAYAAAGGTPWPEHSSNSGLEG
mmetsp:Transcript_74038/g.228829  ORF Transcript_74038/g.228829 Transcript_74038/m.228829 type:complete len:363 (+) Transcript_74038:70-1158(+)